MRTTNERAFEDIPRHWRRFHERGGTGALGDRAGADVFAVYTHFAHEGIDNSGMYSLIIGTQVDPDAPIPDGWVRAAIPPSRQAVFSVARGHPERVGAEWRAIWSRTDISKTFVCDHERCRADGTIDIHVGIR